MMALDTSCHREESQKLESLRDTKPFLEPSLGMYASTIVLFCAELDLRSEQATKKSYIWRDRGLLRDARWHMIARARVSNFNDLLIFEAAAGAA